MNYIIKPREYFTQVSNHILVNPNISFKAKGIYAYLISKPENYQFSAERIADGSKEGRKAILSAIKEIEDSGYLHRSKMKDGRIEYRFFASPVDKARYLNGTVPQSHSGTQAPINNTDLNNNTIINNTKKEKKEKKFDAEKYILELIEKQIVSSEVGKAMINWVEVRKTKKTPTTKKAVDLAVQKILASQDPISMLERSVLGGWTGLFEVKENNSGSDNTEYCRIEPPQATQNKPQDMLAISAIENKIRKGSFDLTTLPGLAVKCYDALKTNREKAEFVFGFLKSQKN